MHFQFSFLDNIPGNTIYSDNNLVMIPALLFEGAGENKPHVVELQITTDMERPD